ncbi:hypothetical protein Tco_0635003 [Tanacetum coccineum]
MLPIYNHKETSDAPSPAKRSKAGKVSKQRKPKSPLQLVDEFVDEGVPEQEHVYGDEEANIQRAMELSIKEQAEHTQEQSANETSKPSCDLLTLSDTKEKEPASTPAKQYIFKRCTPTTTESSGHAESPAKLGLTNSETESDEEVSPKINVGTQDEGQAILNPGDQDEGQAGPNHGIQDKGQAGSNPGDAAESQPQSSHAVHAGGGGDPQTFETWTSRSTNASTTKSLSKWMKSLYNGLPKCSGKPQTPN